MLYHLHSLATLAAATRTLTTVAAASKAGAALRARGSGCQPRHRLLSSPPNRPIIPQPPSRHAPLGVCVAKHARPRRNTLAPIVAAGAAPRARNSGRKTRHRLLSVPPHRAVKPL